MLDRILAHKLQEVERRRAERSLEDVRQAALGYSPRGDFAERLRADGVQVIAELKRVSPSRGVLREGVDAASWVREYVAGGATAVSVLTDERFFGGSDADLVAVRAVVDVPILRKDFVLDAYQVWEARSLGADVVLLIAAALGGERLGVLLDVVREAGMEALVEVHTEEELRWAVEAGAAVVGINNRDLHTFAVSIETTRRLLPLVPPGVVVVSESGVGGPDDVRRLRSWGVDGVLVGETLMRAADPCRLVRELVEAGSGR